ncbi:MAG: inorganic phosphate transporter [Deltaproteobacteria bacterium]|nr:inorganic phosphate transporter [Deltaproteobacteria bacterium]
MDIYTITGVIAIIAGFYMAWNIGANDVANAMGTSVGSKALTLKQAVIVAGIFEFAGAVLVGSHVTNTIRKGMIDPTVFSGSPDILMIGMLSALLASAVWLQLATHWGLPVSTTHSIVGAVVGFALIAIGISGINWGKVAQIIASWVISPVMGGIIATTSFIFIRNRILDRNHPADEVKKYAPYLVFFLFSILTLSMVYKGLKNLKLNLPLYEALGVAVVVGILSALITRYFLRNIERAPGDDLKKELSTVEGVFRHLQIITACYMAFAHGANDVANAIGPLAAIMSISNTHIVVMKVDVPMWILFLGGAGIIIGLATWGYKVIETVGKKITEMTPSRGFSAEFGAATTVLVCSKMGLPISTTHTLVGAVIGVGMARGIASLNLGVVRNIVYSWFITLPVAGLLSVIFYEILSTILL